MRNFFSSWKVVVAAVLIVAVVLFFMSNNEGNQSVTDGQSAPTSITIGYQEISLYQHLFVAKSQKFFEEENIEVTLKPFSSANQMMTALLSGDIDATGLTNMEVAMRIESIEPDQFEFINFLVWKDEAFPDYLMDCRQSESVVNWKDLETATLGRHPGSAVEAFAREVLASQNVSISDWNVIELKPPLMRDSVLSGQIDLLYAMDPVATQLMDLEVCSSLIDNPLGTIIDAPIPIAGTAISRKFLEANPAILVGLTRALDKGIDYTRDPENRDSVMESIAEYTALDQNIVGQLRASEYWKSDEVNIEEVQRIADQFVNLQISEPGISVENMIIQASAP